MADRNNRGGRDRYDRQAEQFDTTEQSWRDDERSSGQMGESAWRDEESSRSDTSRYSRNRDFSRDGNHQRGSDYGRDQTSSYPTGRYGSSPYGAQRPGFASFTSNDYGGRDFSAPRYTGESRSAGAFGGYGAGTRLAENRGEWHEDDVRGYGDRSRGDRGWFERAGDQIASWFGDEDDGSRRREQSYRGHGPEGYTRSDDRIREDVSDALTDDWRVDARKIQVKVTGGEVTLDGTVPSRDHKRRAEDVVEDLSGVKHVQNNLRVQENDAWNRNNNTAETQTTGKA